MSIYDILAFITLLAIVIGYINHRFIGIQTTIAITSGALIISLLLISLNYFNLVNLNNNIKSILLEINFRKFLLDGVLGFLLFAGSINVDFKRLYKYKWEISTLAFLSTIASTIIIGFFSHTILLLIGYNTSWGICFLFGAIVSPTDPIAVIAILKKTEAHPDLIVKITGESLFNDGVGLVIFLTIFQVLFLGNQPTVSSISWLFLKASVGGILYGAIIGYLAHFLIKSAKDIKLEILITIAIASSGYIFAQLIGVSGALAMVVSGLIIGNHTIENAFSEFNQAQLEIFWGIIEELFNLLLFILIGFELMILPINYYYVIAGFLILPFVLFSRFFTVFIPMSLFKIKKNYAPFVITILSWGGLRGGLAIAMALSIPQGADRDLILYLTYTIVVFSIIIQGLTVKPLIKMAVNKFD